MPSVRFGQLTHRVQAEPVQPLRFFSLDLIS